MSPSLSLTRQSLSTDERTSGVPMITQEDRLQPQMTANIATNNKLIKSESFFRLKPPETSRKCESCSSFRMWFPLRACFALLLYHWKTPKKPLNNTILFDLKKIHVKKIRACGESSPSAWYKEGISAALNSTQWQVNLMFVFIVVVWIFFFNKYLIQNPGFFCV